MFKVELRDATKPDRVIEKEIYLPFDPRLSALIRIKKRAWDAKDDLYQVVQGQGVAEIVTEEPDQSKIVVFLKEIRG
jgi:hypothetical protein